MKRQLKLSFADRLVNLSDSIALIIIPFPVVIRLNHTVFIWYPANTFITNAIVRLSYKIEYITLVVTVPSKMSRKWWIQVDRSIGSLDPSSNKVALTWLTHLIVVETQVVRSIVLIDPSVTLSLSTKLSLIKAYCRTVNNITLLSKNIQTKHYLSKNMLLYCIAGCFEWRLLVK